MERVTISGNIAEATPLTQSGFVKILMKTRAEEAASGFGHVIINLPKGSDHRNSRLADPTRPVGRFDPDVIPRESRTFKVLRIALDLYNSKLKPGDFPAIFNSDMTMT